MKLLFSIITALGLSAKAEPPTVSKVDLNAYLGKWYEIKRIDSSFQKGCNQTTATYTKDGDEIIVLNECQKTSDGETKYSKAEGTAKVVDKQTNSKLEVCFFSILGFCLAPGDYWIFDLGEIVNGQYSHAIVGSPSLKYGWVLSRTPTLSEATAKAIDEKLISLGYKLDSFIKTEQK